MFTLRLIHQSCADSHVSNIVSSNARSVSEIQHQHPEEITSHLKLSVMKHQSLDQSQREEPFRCAGLLSKHVIPFISLLLLSWRGWWEQFEGCTEESHCLLSKWDLSCPDTQPCSMYLWRCNFIRLGKVLELQLTAQIKSFEKMNALHYEENDKWQLRIQQQYKGWHNTTLLNTMTVFFGD